MIRPIGFMEKFLQTQMSGLTGHIKEAGFPFDIVEWGQPDCHCENENPGWWVYEQTAYWLDGYIRTGILLKDHAAIQKASTIIYNVINNPDEHGYLGPLFLRTPSASNADIYHRWAHVVFFRSCMALYEYNHDKTIPLAIERHYLETKEDYTKGRNVNNVEIMLWVYSVTKNPEMLEFAIETYETYNRNATDDWNDEFALSDKKPYAHGVSYNEYSKLGAILYMATGNQRYLEASIAAYKKIDKYFMLIDGCHCSNEFLISDNVMQSHETCCVTDYTWAMYYLYLATKNTSYLDRIEKCIFNAGLGAITEDFRALQYFSCVNQVVAAENTNHNSFAKGGKWMSYRPNPGTECCAGNVNRFMPNYILHLWHREGECVYLDMYGDSVYSDEKIEIIEKTDYPFGTKTELTINAKCSQRLKIRIPQWDEGFSMTINGKSAKAEQNNGFVEVVIDEGTSFVELDFCFSPKCHYKQNYTWVTKGPLVYTFAIPCDKQIDRDEERSSEGFPAYNIYPVGAWNYGLKKGYAVEEQNGILQVTAYPIRNWTLLRRKTATMCYCLYRKLHQKVRGDYIFTPPIPKKPLADYGQPTKLTLQPYAFTQLRITAFPIVKQ